MGEKSLKKHSMKFRRLWQWRNVHIQGDNAASLLRINLWELKARAERDFRIVACILKALLTTSGDPENA
jgi:hypothetical protein